MGDYSRDGYRDYDRRPNESRGPLPTRNMMGSRIYVGKLPSDVREKEIEKIFGKYGEITEISLKGNYCFVQYESSRASKDAVYELNDRTVFGDRIQVEHARIPKEFGFRARGSGGYRGYSSRGYGGGYSRDNSRGYNSYRERRRSPPMRSDYRLAVTNLSTRCDRHDLKAVMEKAGDVHYADAHKRRVGEGVVEFASRKDMERALKKLDGLEINGKPIKLEIEEVRKPRRSRSHSRSHSRSRTRSRSRSGSKGKHSSSEHSASGEQSEEEDKEDAKEKKAEDKSDDEEFEEAERSVKRRKQEKGSESESEHEDGSSKDNTSSQALVNGCPEEGDSEKKHSEDDKTEDDDDETEEIEEVVEEIVEEEVEVDDDDDSQSGDIQKEEEQNIDDGGGPLLTGDDVADY